MNDILVAKIESNNMFQDTQQIFVKKLLSIEGILSHLQFDWKEFGNKEKDKGRLVSHLLKHVRGLDLPML